jgi:TnpA family transposase
MTATDPHGGYRQKMPLTRGPFHICRRAGYLALPRGNLRSGACPARGGPAQRTVLGGLRITDRFVIGWSAHPSGRCGRKGGQGQQHYGNDPIIKLYTHITGRYAPFHVKIIAATASEAAHVLDALLETEAGLEIIRHHVDGGGVNDLVFVICHMLGFAFVPRIPDLDGRCLYAFKTAKHYGTLENVIGERIDADLIRAHWDDVVRLATSIRTRTVSASLMLKRLISTSRQNGLAQALRQMGRIERTLFALDWITDKDLRQTTTAELNKGEARNSLVRAVNLHRLGRFRDRSHENLSIRASALNLVVTAIIYWNTLYMGRVVDAICSGGEAVPAHLLDSLSPLGWEHVNLTGDYLWEETPRRDESICVLHCSMVFVHCNIRGRRYHEVVGHLLLPDAVPTLNAVHLLPAAGFFLSGLHLGRWGAADEK